MKNNNTQLIIEICIPMSYKIQEDNNKACKKMTKNTPVVMQ